VITVQGAGASLSPLLGGWLAQWIGYQWTFVLLGSFGLVAAAVWAGFRPAVRPY